MCSVRKASLKIPQNLLENTCVRVSFLVQLQAEACNFIKYEILAQVFSCEFCEIFENTVFTEYLQWLLLKKCATQGEELFCWLNKAPRKQTAFDPK